MTARDIVMSAAGASAPVATDPNFENVTLLLNGDGTNGAQNNTFLDSSTNNFTITRNGNTTQGTFSPYGNLWSNYFDGSGDYLSVADNTALDLDRTTDWTVEGWVYPQSSGNQVIVGSADSGGSSNWALQINSSNQFQGYWLNTSVSSYAVTSASTISLNAWYHVALVNSSGVMSLYVNGASVGTPVTLAGTYRNLSASTSIGRTGDYNGLYWNGSISNLRIVKGTALYTFNFTPSTTPLTAVSGTSLLTCQSNRFIDNSSNNFTITRNGDVKVQRFSPFNPTAPYSAATIGGSGYFDGSGDYLYNTASNAVSFGTGDFTVEYFLYKISGVASGFMQHIGASTVTSSNYAFGENNGAIYATTVDTGFYTNVATPTNQWIHIAWVRASGVMKCYLNGVLLSSFTTSVNASATGFSVGASSSGSYPVGITYLSDIRVVKGTAVYTGNFTPPTLAPLAATGSASAACYPSTTNVNTSFTNTSLLCNFTNAGVWDAAMMNDLETVGNAQVSTSVKKYGTGSLYFDGTGDYLVMPPSPNFTFGTGDFTVEGWVYILAATPTANGIFQQGTSSFPTSTTNTVAFGTVTSGSAWQIYAKNTYFISTATWTTGTWYHFAVVRYSGTTTLYINGTSVITVSSDTTNYTGTYFGVGALYGATPYNHNGYIDDLRVTKGYARYPTEPFPTAALPLY